MNTTVCRICLCLCPNISSTDVTKEEISNFYDELCEYDVYQNPMLQFCLVCEHLLVKFYKFRQKCRKASSLLNCVSFRKKQIDELPKMVPPPSLGYSTRNSVCKVYQVMSSSSPGGAKQKPSYHYNQFDYCLPDPMHATENDLKTSSHCHDSADSNAGRDIMNPLQSLHIDPYNTNICDNHSSRSVDSKAKVTTVTDYFQNFLKDQNENSDVQKKVILNYALKETGTEQSVMDDIMVNNVVLGTVEVANLVMNDMGNELKYTSIITTRDSTRSSVKPNINRIRNRRDATYSPPEEFIQKLTLNPEENKWDMILLYENVNIPEIMRQENEWFLRQYKSKYTRIYARKLYRMKTGFIELLKRGTLRELGLNMDEELYVKLMNNHISYIQCFRLGLVHMRLKKIKTYLVNLYRRNNPEYHTVFTIQPLDTEDKIIDEFNERSNDVWFKCAAAKCELCWTWFDSDNAVSVHKERYHAASLSHYCPVCSVRWPSPTHVLTHMRTTHAFLYRCKQCAFRSTDTTEMVCHYKWHAARHVFSVCPFCDLVFTDKHSFITHRKTVHKGVKFPRSLVACDTCGAALGSRDLLLRHIARGHNHIMSLELACRKYRCCKCWAMLDTVQDRHAHVNTCCKKNTPVTGASKLEQTKLGYRTCQVCQVSVKTEDTSSLYKHHVATHPEVPYRTANKLAYRLCNICGKAISRNTFKDHMNLHLGLRPWACECGSRFATRVARQAHKETHGPPRLCELCGKSFTTGVLYRRHVKLFHGSSPPEYKFKCRLCPKQFLTAMGLHCHIDGVHYRVRGTRRGKQVPTTS